MNTERHNKISEIAQRLYEEEGRPENRAEEHWVQAEALYQQENPDEQDLPAEENPS